MASPATAANILIAHARDAITQCPAGTAFHERGGTLSRLELGAGLMPEQEALSNERMFRAFWESRVRSGDPYAERALEVLDYEGLGAAANLWLSSKALAAGKIVNVDEVNLLIMRAHVERLRKDDYVWQQLFSR